MIEGVIIEKIKTNRDRRGFFREILRVQENINVEQISHSLVYHGVVKGWHGHLQQTQWNYIVNGDIQVALCDLRDDSNTYGETIDFFAGEHYDSFIYSFPPGVLHGYKCINGPMNIVYITSGTYDIKEEIRIDINNSKIKYSFQ